MRARQVHAPRPDDPRRPCDGKLIPVLGHASRGQVPTVTAWRCPCGAAAIRATVVEGVTCALCGCPTGEMRHCGRAHARVMRGEHPEPSITVRIPPEGSPLLPYPHGYAAGPGHHNEVVALPRGLWRPVPLVAAAVLIGARRKIGPWVDVRLAPGQWNELRARAPWLVKGADGARLVNPQIVERFCDLFR